ncbi:MAG: hypothetical protein ACPGVY_11385 [Mycobacterium sp.]
MARNQRDATYDHDLRLKDAGLVAADDIAEVDSADAILDLGAARFDGRVIIDATAVEVASGDERYDVGLQFSDSATFASGVIAGPIFPLGDAAALVGADTDNGAGHYELPFCNEVNGTTYRYMRCQIDVAGTIATGVNFTAHVVQP